MEVSSVDELKREYRLATIIYIAMIATVFVYAVVVELIKKNFVPFKGFAPFPEVYILRYVFLGLTIADFFLIKFIWRKLLSASTQKLIETSVITYALCESVAIYGLILFLAAGSSLDFYTFMILSLSFFGVYFPRYSHWQKWVKVGERNEAIREIRIGEEKAIFTKTEVTLAILLSIFIYTVLWSLGTLMGFFIPVWAVVSLPFIIVTIWKKIKGRRLRTIVISVFLALLVGHLSKIIK
jgi:F0F1-type ATP synthase membrane subunit c/vacuolar-type H+-ATPase subunit K